MCGGVHTLGRHRSDTGCRERGGLSRSASFGRLIPGVLQQFEGRCGFDKAVIKLKGS